MRTLFFITSSDDTLKVAECLNYQALMILLRQADDIVRKLDSVDDALIQGIGMVSDYTV